VHDRHLSTNVDTAQMNYEHLLTSLKERAPSWSATQEQILLEPYEYLISIPGKEVRSALIDAFNVWLQVPGENLAMIKRIVQMLHTASLMCVYTPPRTKLEG